MAEERRFAAWRAFRHLAGRETMITNAHARRFEEAVAEVAREKRPANVAPRLWQAPREAAGSQLQELLEQVEANERLRIGKIKELTPEAVEDLPITLIRARIASGLTKEDSPFGSASRPNSCSVTKLHSTRAQVRAYAKSR